MRGMDLDLLALGAIAAVMIVIGLLPIPHSGMVAVIAGFALTMTWGLAETVWQLFKDVCAVIRSVAKLFRSKPPES